MHISRQIIVSVALLLNVWLCIITDDTADTVGSHFGLLLLLALQGWTKWCQ